MAACCCPSAWVGPRTLCGYGGAEEANPRTRRRNGGRRQVAPASARNNMCAPAPCVLPLSFPVCAACVLPFTRPPVRSLPSHARSHARVHLRTHGSAVSHRDVTMSFRPLPRLLQTTPRVSRTRMATRRQRLPPLPGFRHRLLPWALRPRPASQVQGCPLVCCTSYLTPALPAACTLCRSAGTARRVSITARASTTRHFPPLPRAWQRRHSSAAPHAAACRCYITLPNIRRTLKRPPHPTEPAMQTHLCGTTSHSTSDHLTPALERFLPTGSVPMRDFRCAMLMPAPHPHSTLCRPSARGRARSRHRPKEKVRQAPPGLAGRP